MGITGGLERSVFSRNWSVRTRESNVRSNAVERKRWSSVRAYLCGNEFNSVLAEEDSTSVKSSEATVTQSILEDLTDNNPDIQSGENKEDEMVEKQDSTIKLLPEENAATLIQSAIRGFLARREIKGLILDGKKQLEESSSRESAGTSIEVQTGNSVEVVSIQEERVALHHRVQQKGKTQVLKLKEDWDDSSVSSNISEMRIQNRLEATTRRERALAYAFSQQLRVCSKRKQTKAGGKEPNMGWSWLERWMATRIPESSSVNNRINNQLGQFDINQRFMLGKRVPDVAGEENESCGSNDVSVQFDSSNITAPRERERMKPTQNRLKATRSVSRRKNVPCPKEYAKVYQKNASKETANDIRNKQNQSGSKKEIKYKNTCS